MSTGKEKSEVALNVIREANPVVYGNAQGTKKGKGTKSDPAQLVVEQITGLAVWVLGSAESAKAFLNHPHPMLGRITPLAALTQDLGREKVERILFNIEYSLPA